MTQFAKSRGGMAEVMGLTRATTAGVQLTAGSANTKGSWTQVIASTARSYDSFLVVTSGSSAVNSYRLDLGIGGAGSEQVILPDMFFNYNGGYADSQIWVPVRIPAGSRLSARLQSDTGSATARVVVMGQSGNGLFCPMEPGRVTSIYGSGTTRGIVISTPANNVLSSWVQMVASTTNRIRWLWLIDTLPNTPLFKAADLAIGAGGSEQVIIDGCTWDTVSNLSRTSIRGPFPVDIPSGTRLAVRTQHSYGSTFNEEIALVAIG